MQSGRNVRKIGRLILSHNASFLAQTQVPSISFQLPLFGSNSWLDSPKKQEFDPKSHYFVFGSSQVQSISFQLQHFGSNSPIYVALPYSSTVDSQLPPGFHDLCSSMQCLVLFLFSHTVQTTFRGGNHENFIKVLKRRSKLVDCGYSIMSKMEKHLGEKIRGDNKRKTAASAQS